MPTWMVTKQHGRLQLTFTENGVSQKCGSGDLELWHTLVGWVVDTSSPWDLIAIEDEGVFFRMPSQVAVLGEVPRS